MMKTFNRSIILLLVILQFTSATPIDLVRKTALAFQDVGISLPVSSQANDLPPSSNKRSGYTTYHVTGMMDGEIEYCTEFRLKNYCSTNSEYLQNYRNAFGSPRSGSCATTGQQLVDFSQLMDYTPFYCSSYSTYDPRQKLYLIDQDEPSYWTTATHFSTGSNCRGRTATQYLGDEWFGTCGSASSGTSFVTLCEPDETTGETRYYEEHFDRLNCQGEPTREVDLHNGQCTSGDISVGFTYNQCPLFTWSPTTAPTLEPTAPSFQPTLEPTAPSFQPTLEPTAPTLDPTSSPFDPREKAQESRAHDLFNPMFFCISACLFLWLV